MPRWLPLALAAALVVSARAADAPAAESHELILLDGQRVGSYSLTITRPDASKPFRAVAVTELALKRYGSTAKSRREESTLEADGGQVEALSMKQGVAGGKLLVLEGTRDRDHMHIKVDGGRIDRHVPFPADTVGLRGQQRMFADRKVKPGDRFPFARYDPTYNRVLTVKVVVMDRESVDLLGERKSLLRVELTPDKIEGGGVTVRPPASVVWLDDTLAIARRQQVIDGIGAVIFARVSREKFQATAPAAVDVGARSLVPLDKPLTRPYDSRAILYRVTVTGDDDPASILCRDEHQEIREAKGATFELRVRPARPGEKGEAKPELPYVAASHFLDHENEAVADLARKAVTSERDPWKKAVRIERFVKGYMRNDNAAPLVPASEIARSPRGDCRHHAFLTAAMCRSAGLPSRTAIGLLYVYRNGPKLGFHMWAEVLIDGRWVGLDSTLGKGGVSAAHVKVSDHSWYDTSSLTPLLPANRALGKLRFEVLRAE